MNLLFVSVYFFYVHCNLLCHIDVIQQQKHREYTVHGLYYYKQNDTHTNLWMTILLLRSASRGMMNIPFLVCDYSWYDFIPFMAWPVKWYIFWYEIHTVAFAEFVPEIYRLLTYYVLSALPLFGRIKKQQQFCRTFFSQRRRLANNEPFKVEVTEICNSRLQLKSPVPMKRFLALSTLLAVLLAVHCYPG